MSNKVQGVGRSIVAMFDGVGGDRPPEPTRAAAFPHADGGFNPLLWGSAGILDEANPATTLGRIAWLEQRALLRRPGRTPRGCDAAYLLKRAIQAHTRNQLAVRAGDFTRADQANRWRVAWLKAGGRHDLI